MPNPKRPESDYQPVSTHTPTGVRRMFNEKAEREREAWRRRREEILPEPPEAA